MRRRGLPQSLLMLACASVVPVLLGACKKPEPAVVDAGPEPVAVIDAAPAVIAALDEDAAIDVPDTGPAHHATGPGLNTNQARVKQCCNALKASAGTDPTLGAFVTSCNSVVVQLGTNGNAPEFQALRTALKSLKVPAVCQGL